MEKKHFETTAKMHKTHKTMKISQEYIQKSKTISNKSLNYTKVSSKQVIKMYNVKEWMYQSKIANEKNLLVGQ